MKESIKLHKNVNEMKKEHFKYSPIQKYSFPLEEATFKIATKIS